MLTSSITNYQQASWSLRRFNYSKNSNSTSY